MEAPGTPETICSGAARRAIPPTTATAVRIPTDGRRSTRLRHQSSVSLHAIMRSASRQYFSSVTHPQPHQPRSFHFDRHHDVPTAYVGVPCAIASVRSNAAITSSSRPCLGRIRIRTTNHQEASSTNKLDCLP
mmetsp:Transcript_34342/g.75192  ORF Transcript_34342/g.75192 Transcript_34342/m.75192 type:complete len:133 (+) Transcript_34342:1086-1484(+)